MTVEIDLLDHDPAMLRTVFGSFPSGVVAIGGLDEQPVGMAASSFTSVSLDPPLVSVCIQNHSTTWPRLRVLPRLGVSVLAEGHDEVCVRLSSKIGDRFAGTDWESTAGGSVFVQGATSWLDCRVHSETAAGDHTVVLLEVLGAVNNPEVAPLVFFGSRFRSLAVAGIEHG